MLFRPRLLPGALFASITTVAAFVLAVAIAYLAYHQPITLNSFLMGLSVLFLLGLALFFTYWTYSFWSMRYRIDRNALTIIAGLSREIVPLANIIRIVPGPEVPWVGPVRGFRWFGYFEGRALVENLGYAVYHCAHPRPGELVYLVTSQSVYAITVKEIERFALELRLRQELGPAKVVQQERQVWWVLRLPFWRDRTALGVIAFAAVINILMFGLVAQAYPDLPDLLSLHFTAQGVVDRVGFRVEVLKLPAMALIVLILNMAVGFLTHARERMITYVLLLGALAVQGLFWVATMRIIY